MKLILYSYFNKDSIQSNIGKPEYSYYYLLQTFLPVLKKLGTIIFVKNPEREVDKIYRACCDQNETCYFFSFSPPNKTLIHLACPTISIFAWEYNNIPDITWDHDPRNDWRNVFAAHGRTMTLSTYAKNVIKNAMGPHFPVEAIPAPVWGNIANVRDKLPDKLNVKKDFKFSIHCKLIDSRDLKYKAHVDKPIIPTVSWYRQHIHPLLPSLVAKGLTLTRGFVSNLIRKSLRKGITLIKKIKKPRAIPIIIDAGVVYTSILNHSDNHKNWHDILTAFCWAHRETPDATLIIKLHTSDDGTIFQLKSILLQLLPFKCRVLLLFGHIDSEEYEKLIEATSYYVNASHCEGLCFPLMEYMACGKPAICPRHTAMKDYIDDSAAFIVKSTLEYHPWLHMTHYLFRTLRYRIEWDSLHDAYIKSYHATYLPSYAKMAECAKERIRSYCEDDVVAKKIRLFLENDGANSNPSSSRFSQLRLSSIKT